jgi:hypothetical protein
LPNWGYCSLVKKNELIVGGYNFINVYSLPSLSVRSFKLDFSVEDMILIDNDYLLARYWKELYLLKTSDYKIIDKFKHDDDINDIKIFDNKIFICSEKNLFTIKVNRDKIIDYTSIFDGEVHSIE